MAIKPLTPPLPLASRVFISNDPLEVLVPNPPKIDNLPPVAPDDVPAARTNSPPLPLLPEPTEIYMEPPRPLVADPDPINILPLFPF
jgi:hypothetical protein